MKRRKFLGLAAAGALAAPAAAMPTPPRPLAMTPLEELSPSRCAAPLSVHEAHAMQAANKIKDAILAYRKEMRKACIAVMPGLPVPFMTLPVSVYVRLAQESKLPQPLIPAAYLLDRADAYPECRELLAMGLCYAMVELLPDWVRATPTPAAGLPIQPRRIVSPKYIWDVDECFYDGTSHQRAMMALVSLAVSPALAISRLPEEYQRHARLAVHPLQLYVKREAFMLETFSWCHVGRDDLGWENVPVHDDICSQQTQMERYGLDYRDEQRRLTREARHLKSLEGPC